MIVRRIRLENYRGIESAEVELAPRGLTVVEGPNEVGKSSLAEALWLVIDAKASSKRAEVKALQPVDRDVGPFIEVELSSGPYHVVYRKRFLKGTSTELEVRAPRSEHRTGDEAHERMQQILEETTDLDLFRALQVMQGQPTELPRLDDQGALGRALDAAAGGAGATDDDGALLERAREEFERYWTATGRENKALVEQRSRVETLEGELDELHGRLRRLDQTAAEVERLEAQRRDLATKLPELETRRAEARTAKEALDALRQRVERARAELQAAVAEEKRLAQESATRTEQVKTLAELDKDLAALGGEAEATATRELETARGRVAKAEEALRSLREEDRQLAERLRLAQRDLEMAHEALDLEQLRERQERIEVLERETREARAAVAEIRVDAHALEELRGLERRVTEARARLETAGVGMELRARQPVEVRLDGVPRALSPGAPHRERVTEPTALVVDELLEVRIEPGAGLGDLRDLLERAQGERDARLTEHGVESLAEAEQAAQRRRDAELALASYEERRAVELRDLTIEVMLEKIERLEQRLEADRQERGGEGPPTIDQARARAKAADAARTELARRVEEAEQARDRARALAEEHEKREHQRAARLESLAPQADALREALERARAERSDEALAAELARAVSAREQAERARVTLEANLREQDPEAVETLARTAEQALERAHREHQELGTRLAKLQGQLEAEQESGLAEQLARGKGELEHLRAELARVERRAAAAKLLYATLEEAREEARRSYVRPLTERIERLGRILYGESFRVELSPALGVEARVLDGRRVPFESLSTGAKEQLGVLVRLAVAQVVTEEGGVPVILDDALGNTDPERLQAMSAVLSIASRESQVVLLTCTPERFRALGEMHTVRLSGA